MARGCLHQRPSSARALRKRQSGGAIMLKKLDGAPVEGRLVLSIGLVRPTVPSRFSRGPAPPPPRAAVMHGAAVGDTHGEGASSVAAATAAEAAKADLILGLGDYQYSDGKLSKYN